MCTAHYLRQFFRRQEKEKKKKLLWCGLIFFLSTWKMSSSFPRLFEIVKGPHLHHYNLLPLVKLWEMKKLFILRGNTQSEKKSRSLSGLSVSVCVSNALLTKLTSWAAAPFYNLAQTCTHTQSPSHKQTHARTRLQTLWPLPAPTINQIYLRFGDRLTHSHQHPPSVLQFCPWKKNMDVHSTQTATHTHLPRTHTNRAQTHVHSSTVLQREVNRRVWHPLASCASNAAEKQLNKLWLWQL